MRQMESLTADRPEFGNGLRARLERAQTISRQRTKGTLERLVVADLEKAELPSGTVLTVVSSATDDGLGGDMFDLLLDLSRKVDGRENLNVAHSRAIAVLSRNLARALGLDEDAVRRAYLAGMFHDLGKIELSERLLCKPGPLDQSEWAEMASHAERGANLFDRIGGLSDVAAVVIAHHERWDGIGYPHRIAGEQIPIEARVVAASDAFVTMTSERPFRGALPLEGALTEIIRNAGSGFDPQVVSALLSLTFERRLGIDTPPPRVEANGHSLGLATAV
jgi:putative nucleotidyltransferase with HDIG domain